MRDTVVYGRVLRTINVVADATRECLAIEVDTSPSSRRVERVLDAVARERGRYPSRLVLDNGSECARKALDQWSASGARTWHSSGRGSGSRTARLDFNCIRPHSTLGDEPPTLVAREVRLRPATPAFAAPRNEARAQRLDEATRVKSSVEPTRGAGQSNSRPIFGGISRWRCYVPPMLFELPDHDTLYRALLDRDATYDGRAFVCVSSTGVFCRLTCPARKPKSANCTFFGTVGACLEAGYRACKRCRPLQPMASADPVIAALLAALDERREFRWREADIEHLGFDLSTVRRTFRRQFGMTFLEIARQRRLRDGFQTIADGGMVIEGQLDAGFESASGFRAAFAKMTGKAPGNWASDPLLFADWIPTQLGDMIAVASRSELHLLEFVDRKALRTELARLDDFAQGRVGIGRTAPSTQIKSELEAFFAGRSADFRTPLAYHGSRFVREVWDALRQIPPGQTRSYATLAAALGRPSATRAVARATGANQIALAIPCHRAIGADGSLTGYGGGLWRKQKLLEIERQFLPARIERPAHVAN